MTETKFSRQPLIPVATALAIGIVGDRWFSAPLSGWLLAAAMLAVIWGIFVLRRGLAWSAAALLIWIACVGGARHHLFWSTAAADEVSLFAGEEPRLVRLRATLADQPEIVSPPGKARSAWIAGDATAATLHCDGLILGAAEIPVSGRAGLRVRGRLLSVNVGDAIEICGWLTRPQPARNPGAFDPAEFYRKQGIRCLVTADHPDAVRRVRVGASFSVWRWAAEVRARGESLFAHDLSPRNAPVAAALLFGSRLKMDEEIRDAFAQSGTLHILAISGTHVVILAMLIWMVARLVGLSHRAATLATVAGVVGYTFLTDCRPPVIRATLLICLISSARLINRRAPPANALGLAAIIILLWNPTDLFDVGAQLSFLGAMALLWSAFWRSQAHVPDAVSEFRERQALSTAGRFARKRVWPPIRNACLVSIAAALFTMPLIAARFHMVSPISVVINVVLAPFSTFLLWTGYLHAGVGLVVPGVSRLFALPFDWCLTAFIGLVERAAHLRMSHAYVPGPSNWWLAGYYGLLFAIAFLPPIRGWGGGLRRWSLLATWSIIGLAWGLRSPAPDGLRCTFLSVGHGGAILLETPAGRTLLYDAGSLQDGRVAQRAVQSTLWDRRHAGLDAIVISHADVDHFNGVAGLMESLPVGRLFVSRQFLDFRQSAVASVCESSALCGVPIGLIQEGDRLRLDDSVKITVLHPPPIPATEPTGGHSNADDNANSTVLLVEYAGRRILLTGDLDGSGQVALLQQPACGADVLLAPHHGSRKANSAALASWAGPKFVVVSGDRHVDLKSLRAAYGSRAHILSTYEAGAVTFLIGSDGTLSHTTVRERRSGGIRRELAVRQ